MIPALPYGLYTLACLLFKKGSIFVCKCAAVIIIIHDIPSALEFALSGSLKHCQCGQTCGQCLHWYISGHLPSQWLSANLLNKETTCIYLNEHIEYIHMLKSGNKAKIQRDSSVHTIINQTGNTVIYSAVLRKWRNVYLHKSVWCVC